MTRTALIIVFVCAISGVVYGFINFNQLKSTLGIEAPVESKSDRPKTKKPDVTKKNQVGDVDFGPYMADLQRKIKKAWFPPKGNESKHVKVVFKIHKDGRLSNLTLKKSSGLKTADQAALKAVENATPFKPLPAGAPKDVDILFTFDYNVHKTKASK